MLVISHILNKTKSSHQNISTKLIYVVNNCKFFFCFIHEIGGKPITNDVTDSLTNGHTTENGAVVESVIKTEVSIRFQSFIIIKVSKVQSEIASNWIYCFLLQLSQNQQNPASGKDGDQSNTQVSVVPGPQSASHVVVDEKKKKKCTCCVIQ